MEHTGTAVQRGISDEDLSAGRFRPGGRFDAGSTGWKRHRRTTDGESQRGDGGNEFSSPPTRRHRHCSEPREATTTTLWSTAGGAVQQLMSSAAVARASGRTEYQIQRPRRSRSTRPESKRTFRWWLTVGWERPSGSTRSHAHDPPGWEAMRLNSLRRTGSPSTANTAARRWAVSSSSAASVTGGQHAMAEGDFMVDII